jgi:hypothetical protein
MGELVDWVHAGITGAVALALLGASVIIFDCSSAALRLAMLAFYIVVSIQCVHLLFDAALFRLALAHDNEQAGLAAIDRTLAAMGLRKMPAQPAPLAQRLAGTARLLRHQYIMLAMGAAIFGFMLFDCGTARC